jgi:hypothetical protein
MAKMDLLRGVELRPGRKQINLFQPQNCEAARVELTCLYALVHECFLHGNYSCTGMLLI